jgi:hypothetical protein
MRELDGSLEVETCCRCLAQPARFLTGHVTRGPHIVAAGWCEECHEELHGSHSTRFYALAAAAIGEKIDRSVRSFLESTCMGWCGHWVPAMGLRLRGSPSIAAARAAKREQRIALADPSPRDALAMHFGEERRSAKATSKPEGA